LPKIRVWPYKQGSRSAKALADALGGKVLKKEGSKYVRRAGDAVINWGDSSAGNLSCYNLAGNVALAANKLLAFRALKEAGVNFPDFSSDKQGVKWEGLTVVRHKLSGHSGEGVELRDAGDLPSAPLYVQYVPKKTEYRVHVVGKQIVLVQRKARNPNCDNPNWKVRNHDNGFIFVRNDVKAPSSVEEQAVRAIKALGLDFGAVDIIWNDKQQKAYVLEVNTAPGLEGSTVDDYARGFRNLIGWSNRVDRAQVYRMGA
jgi:glutathione synthase/RimK-type ligase-like ATP-grasp enzyme